MEKAARRRKPLSFKPGDVVLLRTGWGAFFEDVARFESQMHGPGPGEQGARWLSGKGIFAAGGDTINFELVPSRTMPVHVHLLVESGIHIIECLNLEQLAADRVYEFAFVASPLKIRGATGLAHTPVRAESIASGCRAYAWRIRIRRSVRMSIAHCASFMPSPTSTDLHQELKQAVGELCRTFPDAYWRELDSRAAIRKSLSRR